MQAATLWKPPVLDTSVSMSTLLAWTLLKAQNKCIKTGPEQPPLQARWHEQSCSGTFTNSTFRNNRTGALALLRLNIPALKKAGEWVKIAASSGTAAALEYQQDAARSPSLSLSASPSNPAHCRAFGKKRKSWPVLMEQGFYACSGGQSWTKTVLMD